MAKFARIAIIPLILFTFFFASCAPSSDDGAYQDIHAIADPREFSIAEWEIETLGQQLWESLKPASREDADGAETVRVYFASIEQNGYAESELEDRAERILARQIRGVLIEEGITNPLDKWIPAKMVFPPVNFEFEAPPNLLVLSPTDEIRLLRRITLEPGLTTTEKEAIESQVDALGYSSLVVGLGGVGFTCPTMVYETGDIRRAIDIAVEEWFHQYMAFKPLGFLYVLDSAGWRADYDIITMNETTAGIVCREIGEKVYQKYYGEGEGKFPPEEPDSEFDLEMRRIRLKVDEYLAAGEAAAAEEYMARMRDFLASKGYHIRKLNQAYFAFHGTYADKPTTTSPIGQDLQKLREQCSSLKQFLDTVTGMTGCDDLENALEER
ncbi:MAG: hypothetical protein R6U37_09480 [Dehalococcoidia bacterium]